MNKEKNKVSGGLIYSTNPDFNINQTNQVDESFTPEPKSQDLRVEINRRLKAGKIATLITGYQGKVEDLEELGKKIKSFCGTGGSVKEGNIIIQGDFREKVLAWLIKAGYKAKKSGG